MELLVLGGKGILGILCFYKIIIMLGDLMSMFMGKLGIVVIQRTQLLVD